MASTQPGDSLDIVLSLIDEGFTEKIRTIAQGVAFHLRRDLSVGAWPANAAPSMMMMLVGLAGAAVASPRKVSRRRLLRFWKVD